MCFILCYKYVKQKLYNMKKIERLKSSKDSNFQKETVGQKLSQFRNKLNEIIDYINDKEQMEEYKRCVEEVVNELISENLNDDDDIVIESDEQ
jgi:hypothetical protein